MQLKRWLRSWIHKGMLFVALAISFVLLGSSGAVGAPLQDVPVVVQQPNGEVLHLFATGDEFYNWVHDKAGYAIVRDPKTGYAEYARVEAGRLVPSGYRVGSVDPAMIGLEPGLNLPPERMEELRQPLSMPARPGVPGEEIVLAPTSGTINNLVVFIRFSDESEFTDAISIYDGQFNTSTVSMYNYFQEVSYNALSTSTTFYPTTPWTTIVSYQDAQPRAYYKPYDATTNPTGYMSWQRTDREHTLLANAINAISDQVPLGLNIDGDGDGNVDNVCFVVYGSPSAWGTLLWPHMWSLYTKNVYINSKRVYTFNFQLQSVIDVSVLCHEMFHSLGAPDLYRYYDGTITPVGQWDLMAWDNGQHMGAYMKYEYGGWIASIPEITPDGNLYTLNPLTSPTGQCYKIASNNSPTEYFVVEYRRDTGAFESGVPATGLIVYRINSSVTEGNRDGPPDEVYIYRPGGTDPTTNGSINSANYSSDVGRTAIDDTTSPSSFLSDGSPGGLCIHDIGSAGSTISFRLGAPEIDVQRPAATSIPDGGTDYVGSKPPGVAATIVYTVENKNTASGTLSITGVTASGLSNCSGFTVNTTLPLDVAVGSSATLSVSITPTTAGSFSFDMDIANNDSNENPYDIAIVGSPPPAIDVSPAALSTTVAPGGTGSTSLSIANVGGGDLEWSISVQNVYVSALPSPNAPMASGGPDTYGYEWRDSDELGGPTYGWVDITGTGTALSLDDDASSSALPLQFTFDFYGANKTSVYVGSNGFLQFGGAATDYSNDPIPDALVPDDIIAPFWDDLNPSASGEIYCLSEPGRFIVSWIGVPRYYSSGSNTFQAILYSDGRILFQYQSMGNGAILTSATTGIENIDASDGLQIAYNETYVTDNLAVRITPPATWIAVSPTAGTTAGNGSTPISVDLDAAGLTDGTLCTADIVITSNDLDTPSVTVGVTMNVSSGPSPEAAVFRVTSTGDVLADGPFYGSSFETGSADIAEWVPVSEPVEPGDVLELDPENPGHYRRSSGLCSDLVAGVVSTDPGFILGSRPATGDSGPSTPDRALLALIGIVPINVTNEGGRIAPGDLLVSSSTPGYAMRWDPQSVEVCGLIGKALEPLDSGIGVIQALLMR